MNDEAGQRSGDIPASPTLLIGAMGLQLQWTREEGEAEGEEEGEEN